MSAILTVVIDNPHLLGAVCGPQDCNLSEISTLLAAPVRTRGNEILPESSDDESRLMFRSLLERVVEIAEQEDIVGINAVTEFDSGDVVRHPLVKKIIDAYQNKP